MCYPKPGPRCSNHLAKDIHKSSVRLAWLTNHGNHDNELQMTEKDTLTQRREELLREYDGTLAGQKKLETAIASMSDGDPDYEDIVAYKKSAKSAHTKKANAYKKAVEKDPALASYEASVEPANVSQHADDSSIDFPHSAYDVSLPGNLVARYEVSYNPEMHTNPSPKDKVHQVRMSYTKYSDNGKVIATGDKYFTVDQDKKGADQLAQRLALSMKRKHEDFLRDEDGLPQM